MGAVVQYQSFQLPALIRRYVVDLSVLAELQRANIGDDRPAILWRYTVGVGIHHAEAVGDHVEEVASRRLAQPILVERGRRREAALHDHAVAVADRAVARA